MEVALYHLFFLEVVALQHLFSPYSHSQVPVHRQECLFYQEVGEEQSFWNCEIMEVCYRIAFTELCCFGKTYFAHLCQLIASIQVACSSLVVAV